MAFISIPEAQINQVDYLIDGKLRWIGTGNPPNTGIPLVIILPAAIPVGTWSPRR